jgi:transketolase
MQPYEQKLFSLIEKNKNIIILTAENRISLRNIPLKLDNNFIDVGISEQNLVGISAGLAKSGFLPIMHGMSAFLTMRAFEFVRTDLGYPSLPSVLVGTFNGLSASANGTANGPTHQAIEDIALMRLIPNMTVVAPSDLPETLSVLDNIEKLNGPLYIRDSNFETIDLERKPFEWLKNECMIKGEKIAILSYGTILDICIKVSKKLTSENIVHSVYNMRFIKPVDKIILNEIFDNHETIFVVEDHINTGSLNSIVKEFAFDNNKFKKIIPINLKNDFFKPGNFEDSLDTAGFSRDKIFDRIKKDITF